jgi:hypothetical protein
MVATLRSWWWLVGYGLLTGAAIAAVDNLLFEGEVSPIVIVGLLLATTASAGAIWGARGLAAAALTWAWVPAAHVLKRTLGLPDTLHPNTWASVLILALFTLAVTAVGTGCGLLARRLSRRTLRPAEPLNGLEAKKGTG